VVPMSPSVTKIEWECVSEELGYVATRVGDSYIVCTQDSTCFVVNGVGGCGEAFNAVEAYARSEVEAEHLVGTHQRVGVPLRPSNQPP